MRIDLLLKQSGLIKRRVIAKEFCERGLVLINGKEAKPSTEVKDGDDIEVKFGQRIVSCHIVFETVGKKTIVHVTANDVKNTDECDA